MGAGRRDVGRARLQPAVGRVAGAPARSTASASSSASSARRCREFWNPDVFGYNGQLPQLMRGAGITRFLTQKLSWNQLHPAAAPHVPLGRASTAARCSRTSRPPTPTTPTVTVARAARAAPRSYKDHDRSAHSLLLFGYGDGGGGPTAAMLERAARARSDLQGVPRTQLAHARRVLRRLEAETDDWPVVVGELYFEYHRGTYTSQAAHQARQPPLRARCCTTPRSWRRRRPAGRRAVPARASCERAVGDAAAARSSTTSCPALDQRGLRGRRARPRGVDAERPRRCARRRSRALGGGDARAAEHARRSPRREVAERRRRAARRRRPAVRRRRRGRARRRA